MKVWIVIASLLATQQVAAASENLGFSINEIPDWRVRVLSDRDRREKLAVCLRDERDQRRQLALEECKAQGIGSSYEDGCKEYVKTNRNYASNANFQCAEWRLQERK